MEFDFEKLTRKYPFPEKRPRHHIAPYFYIPISKLKVIPPNYPKPIENISWNIFFQNGKKPDFLDIGTGRGKFLLEFALSNPQKNILGIEIKKDCVDWLQKVIEGEAIINANVLWHNVLNGLNFLEDNSLEGVFYLFPDPWPKSRHSKRRALNSEIIKEIALKLKPNGKFYLATDNFLLHNEHIELLTKSGKFSINTVEKEEEWNLPKTNKEISCIKRNVQYYRLVCGKSETGQT